MGKRGIIGFIIANPEEIFQQRLMDGVFEQCRKYGYDCAVFSPLVKADLVFEEYLNGELNIFSLINFDKLEGVIVATFSLIEGNTTWVKDYIEDLLKEKCTKPVVSLGLPLNDYPIVTTDDRTAFEEITDHLIDVHGCKDMFFLSGMEGNTASEDRIQGFKDSLEKHGMKANDEHIFYGDFYYPSGDALADRIIAKELPLPEAIVCANDCMAVAIINRLRSNGINVPEDVIVTGFDATPETIINKITVTSFLPDTASAAAESVNIIVKTLYPDREIIPTDKGDSGLRPLMSCGCPEDIGYIKSGFNQALIVNPCHGDPDFKDTVAINEMLNSFMFENFTSAETVDECLSKISESAYLLRPYERYFLCLEENWTDNDRCTINGYTDTMKLVIVNDSSEAQSSGKKQLPAADAAEFDVSLMLPQLYEERDHPCVFYFVPMHFSESAMGYSVLQCSAGQQRKIDTVFRNWIKNVNNALEMTRAQSRLTVFSERDAMTGLYNRRGMQARLIELNAKKTSQDSWLVMVIDMDGLKTINDTYGHSEGDYGINVIASAVRQILRTTELCVRAGGDEFYIIGLGEYKATDAIIRIEKFKEALAEENKSDKPYTISASIGYCCEPCSSGTDINYLIDLADSRMYENKVSKKAAR